MRIALLEPYYGGSHKAWADGYKAFSAHDVQLVTLPAQFWKWRMQGGAISLARMLHGKPDLILASGMLDLSTFRALTFRQFGDIPHALYLHENQLSYPQNQRQGHGWRYGFINYISALAADRVYFNSDYHRQDFMAQLPRMLKHFADFNELETIDAIAAKSRTLPPGMDLRRFDAWQQARPAGQPPLILWNHRWEADKNPAGFAESLMQLADEGIDFQAAITGPRFGVAPEPFKRLQDRMGGRLIQLGYVESFAEYAGLLWRADYVVSSAWQEFFGMAICEAIYCGCAPILPDRLNYPGLLPDSCRSACLYSRDRLAAKLRHHLTNDIPLDRGLLRERAAAFDWRALAPNYDAEFEALITSHRRMPRLV